MTVERCRINCVRTLITFVKTSLQESASSVFYDSFFRRSSACRPVVVPLSASLPARRAKRLSEWSLAVANVIRLSVCPSPTDIIALHAQRAPCVAPHQLRKLLTRTFRQQLGADYSYDSASVRLRFDSHSTAVRPRHDHSTTYVTIGLLHCGLNK